MAVREEFCRSGIGRVRSGICDGFWELERQSCEDGCRDKIGEWCWDGVGRRSANREDHRRDWGRRCSGVRKSEEDRCCAGIWGHCCSAMRRKSEEDPYCAGIVSGRCCSAVRPIANKKNRRRAEARDLCCSAMRRKSEEDNCYAETVSDSEVKRQSEEDRCCCAEICVHYSVTRRQSE